ncbi:MAG: hypothetical protein MHM6MM_004240 [Cercozoa sp. M6MM]
MQRSHRALARLRLPQRALLSVLEETPTEAKWRQQHQRVQAEAEQRFDAEAGTSRTASGKLEKWLDRNATTMPRKQARMPPMPANVPTEAAELHRLARADDYLGALAAMRKMPAAPEFRALLLSLARSRLDDGTKREQLRVLDDFSAQLRMVRDELVLQAQAEVISSLQRPLRSDGDGLLATMDVHFEDIQRTDTVLTLLRLSDRIAHGVLANRAIVARYDKGDWRPSAFHLTLCTRALHKDKDIHPNARLQSLMFIVKWAETVDAEMAHKGAPPIARNPEYLLAVLDMLHGINPEHTEAGQIVRQLNSVYHELMASELSVSHKARVAAMAAHIYANCGHLRPLIQTLTDLSAIGEVPMQQVCDAFLLLHRRERLRDVSPFDVSAEERQQYARDLWKLASKHLPSAHFDLSEEELLAHALNFKPHLNDEHIAFLAKAAEKLSKPAFAQLCSQTRSLSTEKQQRFLETARRVFEDASIDVNRVESHRQIDDADGDTDGFSVTDGDTDADSDDDTTVEISFDSDETVSWSDTIRSFFRDLVEGSNENDSMLRDIIDDLKEVPDMTSHEQAIRKMRKQFEQAAMCMASIMADANSSKLKQTQRERLHEALGAPPAQLDEEKTDEERAEDARKAMSKVELTLEFQREVCKEVCDIVLHRRRLLLERNKRCDAKQLFETDVVHANRLRQRANKRIRRDQTAPSLVTLQNNGRHEPDTAVYDDALMHADHSRQYSEHASERHLSVLDADSDRAELAMTEKALHTIVGRRRERDFLVAGAPSNEQLLKLEAEWILKKLQSRDGDLFEWCASLHLYTEARHFFNALVTRGETPAPRHFAALATALFEDTRLSDQQKCTEALAMQHQLHSFVSRRMLAYHLPVIVGLSRVLAVLPYRKVRERMALLSRDQSVSDDDVAKPLQQFRENAQPRVRTLLAALGEMYECDVVTLVRVHAENRQAAQSVLGVLLHAAALLGSDDMAQQVLPKFDAKRLPITAGALAAIADAAANDDSLSRDMRQARVRQVLNLVSVHGVEDSAAVWNALLRLCLSHAPPDRERAWQIYETALGPHMRDEETFDVMLLLLQESNASAEEVARVVKDLRTLRDALGHPLSPHFERLLQAHAPE